MCKYCKRLKQLNGLDEKRYKEIISAWRSRDVKARRLLERVQDMIMNCNITPYNEYCSRFFNEDAQLYDDITEFLECSYVGK